jgi:RNA-directed DNA polymerase
VRASRKKEKRTTVPFGATPAREPMPVREWANRTVWNERMLDALVNEVRGGKWHTLWDKVFKGSNLIDASMRVLRNDGSAGVDRQTVDQFEGHILEETSRLGEELRSGKYRPHPVKRVWIPKAGSDQKRPLGIPCVRDRVVQTALLSVLEPIYEMTFAEHSYGFRRGRGCHHALERVEALLGEGKVYVVDADLKSYFDTIPKDRLMDRVRERVSDSRVLGLVEQFLNQGVLDGLSEWTPVKGTPQGAVISPLLANLYLNPLDHLMADSGYAMVRYADDFVVLCESRVEAERALAEVAAWVAASGEDEDRGCTGGGFRFSRLHVSGYASATTEEQSGEVEGNDPRANGQNRRSEHGGHRLFAPRHDARLVRVLPPLPSECVCRYGQMDSDASA